MALDLQNKYPGRFDPKSVDYPQGKFKNRSSPTAQDGSYMERDWLNDWNGFFGALLSNAGVTPNGNVDTAQSSQFFSALQAIITRQLPKRAFSTNDFIRIPDVPGGLIIQWGYTSGTGVHSTNFPTAFPNACLNVYTTAQGNSVSNGYVITNKAGTTNTYAGFVSQTTNAASATVSYTWLAVGY